MNGVKGRWHAFNDGYGVARLKLGRQVVPHLLGARTVVGPHEGHGHLLVGQHVGIQFIVDINHDDPLILRPLTHGNEGFGIGGRNDDGVYPTGHHLLDQLNLPIYIQLVFDALGDELIIRRIFGLMSTGPIFHSLEKLIGKGFHNQGHDRLVRCRGFLSLSAVARFRRTPTTADKGQADYQKHPKIHTIQHWSSSP